MATSIIEARVEQNRRDHNNRAWLAWHIAVMPNQRRMPSLKSLQIPERQSKPQSWREQMQIARMLTVAYGGSVH